MKKHNFGLYQEEFEFDSCGVGFVANIKGVKSHQIISDALTMLENMEHRGATGYEKNTGDGAGIQIQIPHELLFEAANSLGFDLPRAGQYAVGMLFFPKNRALREECRHIINRSADKLGFKILGYREVPVDNSDLGEAAKSVEPHMEQIFIERPFDITDDTAFERRLFVLRNYTSHQISNITSNDPSGFYVASLSVRKIIYKGQLRSLQVRSYFKDLTNPKATSAFGMVHSRFATNTTPSWRLAQPFRFLAHNGEINTVQGNLNWLRSSEKNFESKNFTKQELDMVLPLVPNYQSDSACLDNVVEMLVHSGRSLPHVMMMLIPEAWDGHESMDEEKKAFYEYHACMMEPWDGPASVSFTDGNIIGATLDRNGLRPSRFCVTDDDRVIMSSESGALPVDPNTVIKQGRLQPGKMFLVDMSKGEIISDDDLKKNLATSKPYKEWLDNYKIKLEDIPTPKFRYTRLEEDQISILQRAFGYTREDMDMILKEMATSGKEPMGSMGVDTPIAVLSEKPQHLSNYFKQLFAQVTNPPIDPLRERLVMSLSTVIGSRHNLLDEDPMAAHCITLPHPLLNNESLEKIRSIDTGIFQSKTIQTYFKASGEPGVLKKALDRICRYAMDAIDDGYELIILSDRNIDSEHAAIPSLLACSAVHHHLIRNGVRGRIGLIVEAGDVIEVHHFATLIGFGATAINPYLALSGIRKMKDTGVIDSDLPIEKLKENYFKSVKNGLLKIFSKMGISTLQSYHGAQIFEILGISNDVVKQYFAGAVSRIEGVGLDEIARETLTKHFQGFKSPLHEAILPEGGLYQWKRKGEYHMYNPETVHLLQQATRKGDYALFKKYSLAADNHGEKACTIRSLLTVQNDRDSVPLSEVEPIEKIMPRFATGAMSFGSISWEAHTTLAMAMNRIGAKSNTGEGGEDEKRYEKMANGDSMRSAIKQVASGRFGVTSKYLAEADEIQIKMAQGAKPGEGGQLPGFKVDDWIGRVRNSTPGVGLISPPPHHDIYSIEDLSQLIFDLKHANRDARISVKLVSKAGVGTIASGVAKAKADHILIAGYDGGTGASPMSSIKHTGLPWELGLVETHQTLVKNKLRQRVTIQTDGQIKTGQDIVMATLLGAEEWGIATAALVVEGCILMRKCHLNTCPVGIATQNPDLRQKFAGKVEHVVNFFTFLAMETREIMAELGFRTIDEMVGQYQCLVRKKDLKHWKYDKVDLTRVMQPIQSDLPLYKAEPQDHELELSLDWKLIDVAKDAIENKGKVKAAFDIINTDRATGTILSHEVTKVYGSEGMPTDSLHFKFTGTAGQSFGAFCNKGITLEIEGDANDYFGKGLSGAHLAVYPSKDATFKPEENSIIGNVAFYGATGGKAFIRGMAGERFCVRNSGVTAVVEGIGDHGCEYMTGGTALILGDVGRNFAAGMSGGIAYIWDVNKTLKTNLNAEMVDVDPLDQNDITLVKGLLEEHIAKTGSALATFLLKDFDNNVQHIAKIFPRDYKAVLKKRAEQAKAQ
ncbi:MAG: glutamate synthase large subunit [Flavobacteriales bacterium]|nr:glutamate synthase large subunit [Flavobacteriales bacterium]